MSHRLMELGSRVSDPRTLRMIYIILVLVAMAVAGGAPTAYPTGH